MFEGRQFECSSQHKVRLLVGTLPAKMMSSPIRSLCSSRMRRMVKRTGR